MSVCLSAYLLPFCGASRTLLTLSTVEPHESRFQGLSLMLLQERSARREVKKSFPWRTYVAGCVTDYSHMPSYASVLDALRFSVMSQILRKRHLPSLGIQFLKAYSRVVSPHGFSNELLIAATFDACSMFTSASGHKQSYYSGRKLFLNYGYQGCWGKVQMRPLV